MWSIFYPYSNYFLFTNSNYNNNSWHIFVYLILISIVLYFIGIYKGYNRADNKIQVKAKSDHSSFSKIAGLEEAKRELNEIMDFMKNPQRFKKLGAKIPKGIILYGPPGTGKTLLAKSLANEAGVEFISVSGSEFVEKYVGMGAARIRELFSRVRGFKSAVIFIDELDALGKKRGDSDMAIEKDQTLNQLLTELDGFNSSDDSFVVIGATNRLNILDPALLRPGRFDRHISIGYPSFKERCEILKVHYNNKPIKDIDLENLAYQTSGMTGADLANICNESAIIAARNNRDFITNSDINFAVDRIIAGIEKNSFLPSKQEKERVAYHEAGHTICGFLMSDDSIKKVSILPRGEALGFTIHNGESDKYLYTPNEIKNKIICLMGGRAAEELIYGEASSGAANDIEKATEIALKMVSELGMSDKGISNCVYILEQNPEFAFEEVNKILTTALEKAKQILSENKEFLYYLADYLLKNESMEAKQIEDLYYSIKH